MHCALAFEITDDLANMESRSELRVRPSRDGHDTLTVRSASYGTTSSFVSGEQFRLQNLRYPNAAGSRSVSRQVAGHWLSLNRKDRSETCSSVHPRFARLSLLQ